MVRIIGVIDPIVDPLGGGGGSWNLRQPLSGTSWKISARIIYGVLSSENFATSFAAQDRQQDLSALAC